MKMKGAAILAACALLVGGSLAFVACQEKKAVSGQHQNMAMHENMADNMNADNMSSDNMTTDNANSDNMSSDNSTADNMADNAGKVLDNASERVKY